MTSRLKEVTSFRNNLNSITLGEGEDYTQGIPIQFSYWKIHTNWQLFEYLTTTQVLLCTEAYGFYVIYKVYLILWIYTHTNCYAKRESTQWFISAI